MLVYERKKKNPLTEIVLEPSAEPHPSDAAISAAYSPQATPAPKATLECANTATTRVETVTASEASSQNGGGLLQVPYNKTIPFRQVEPYAPEWIK